MAFQSFSACGGSDDENQPNFNEFMGPGAVDSSVRQALQMLWMTIPADRRNVQEVEKEFRRLVDRALRDLREDADAFGTP